MAESVSRLATDDAYQAGHLAGKVEARLAAHDAHFVTINGHVGELVSETHELRMQVQRLADQAVADAKTRVSTADAVEKAREEAASALESERKARTDRSDLAWTPVNRALAVLAGVSTIVAIVVTLVTVLR